MEKKFVKVFPANGQSRESIVGIGMYLVDVKGNERKQTWSDYYRTDNCPIGGFVRYLSKSSTGYEYFERVE